MCARVAQVRLVAERVHALVPRATVLHALVAQLLHALAAMVLARARRSTRASLRVARLQGRLFSDEAVVLTWARACALRELARAKPVHVPMARAYATPEPPVLARVCVSMVLEPGVP